jgi:hypothetical protein
MTTIERIEAAIERRSWYRRCAAWELIDRWPGLFPHATLRVPISSSFKTWEGEARAEPNARSQGSAGASPSRFVRTLL